MSPRVLHTDQDNDGYVTATELRRMMKQLGNELTEQEVNDIMKEAGTDRAGGRIDYAAFCKLLGNDAVKQSLENEADEEMQHAFNLFDTDRDGLISAKEMRSGLASFNITLTEREVNQLIEEATLAAASRGVNYEIFKRVMSANR